MYSRGNLTRRWAVLLESLSISRLVRKRSDIRPQVPWGFPGKSIKLNVYPVGEVRDAELIPVGEAKHAELRISLDPGHQPLEDVRAEAIRRLFTHIPWEKFHTFKAVKDITASFQI